MNVEGKRYVGGDFPVHLLTMGKLFNKRLVPCAFGIKIGLYFHNNKSRQQTGLVFLLAASQRECSDFFARNRGSRRFINAEIVAIFTKNGLQFSYVDGK